jgi:hypothetical protein
MYNAVHNPLLKLAATDIRETEAQGKEEVAA